LFQGPDRREHQAYAQVDEVHVGDRQEHLPIGHHPGLQEAVE
jgi:hypothetical protein